MCRRIDAVEIGQSSEATQAAEHAGLDGAHEALDIGLGGLWRFVEGRVGANAAERPDEECGIDLETVLPSESQVEY